LERRPQQVGNAVKPARRTDPPGALKSAEFRSQLWAHWAENWKLVATAQACRNRSSELDTMHALRMSRFAKKTITRGVNMPDWDDLGEACFMAMAELDVFAGHYGMGRLAAVFDQYRGAVWFERGEGEGPRWHVWDERYGHEDQLGPDCEDYGPAVEAMVEALGIELERRGLIPFARREPFGTPKVLRE